MGRAPTTKGFTFLEVLACLLVVGLGLASVIAMVWFGIVNAQKSQAASTAMITAMSVAVDPTPYLSSDLAGAWTASAPYDMDDRTDDLTESQQGFINGYLVHRSETTTPADVIAADTSPGTGATVVYARSVLVKVDVYALLNGAIVASYNTRFIRQRNQP